MASQGPSCSITPPIDTKSEIERHCQDIGVTWKFIPPRFPHHDGIREAAVKSGKRCLLNATRGVVLTSEQLITFLTQIEAILNSRLLY